MLQLIVGKKGSGKTKRLIDMVNAEIESAKGDVVFIDDDKRDMYDVKHQVRFVNVKDYDVCTEERFYGFLCGMLSQNFDISAIYIDAFLHIIGKDDSETEWFFKELVKLTKENSDLKFVLNVSAGADEIPDFMKDYMI